MQELEAGPLHRFQDWPNDHVPKRAAGVYTVWDGDRLLYVGMSDRAMTTEDSTPPDGPTEGPTSTVATPGRFGRRPQDGRPQTRAGRVKPRPPWSAVRPGLVLRSLSSV